MSKEEKFHPLDMINRELNTLGAKQLEKGWDAMDVAIFEKLTLTKVKILTELTPLNAAEAKRVQLEISDMLVENLLQIMDLKPIEKLSLPNPKKKRKSKQDESKTKPTPDNDRK